MERLTARNENGDKEAYYPHCFQEDTCDGCGSSEKCNSCVFSREVCEALASYEDTGLTPEQIQELKDREMNKMSMGVDKGYIPPWVMEQAALARQIANLPERTDV